MVEGMKSNILIWVTDRSYNWKRAADLCGVGWIIFCSKTGLHLTATFWERTILASSFRAEMLGLCALHLHLLARALLEFYIIQGWKASLCCNNKRALELSLYMCRYPVKPESNEAHLYRKIHLPACVRPYGQIPSLAQTISYPEAQLRMRHSRQASHDISNDSGHLQKANPPIN